MKNRITFFKQILLGALIIGYQSDVLSQENDSSKFEHPGMYIGFNLGPSESQIINIGSNYVSVPLSGKANSYFGSVDIGYSFSKTFGLSSGIGFKKYSTQLTLDNYQNEVNAIDSENEKYLLHVSGTGIIENQIIDFITIPLCFNLRITFGKIFGFFMQPGINMSFPLDKNYESGGTFTYKGFYPAYNVMLQNLPEYGFPSDLNSKSDGDLEIKPFCFNAVVSAGFDFLIKYKVLIGIGACYDKSLSSISNYTSTDTFQLSSEANEINSLMGGSSKITTQSIGVKFVFRYYFK